MEHLLFYAHYLSYSWVAKGFYAFILLEAISAGYYLSGVYGGDFKISKKTARIWQLFAVILTFAIIPAIYYGATLYEESKPYVSCDKEK